MYIHFLVSSFNKHRCDIPVVKLPKVNKNMIYFDKVSKSSSCFMEINIPIVLQQLVQVIV